MVCVAIMIGIAANVEINAAPSAARSLGDAESSLGDVIADGIAEWNRLADYLLGCGVMRK